MKKEITTEDLKKAAGGFATGVTIITSKEADDSIVGMTASSFVSVSFDPPLVSFFVDNNATFVKRLQTGATFGISILSSDQQKDSNHFAGYPDPEHPIVFDESEGFPLIHDGRTCFGGNFRKKFFIFFETTIPPSETNKSG